MIDYINKAYVLQLSAYVDIIEDNYNEGQKDMVNCYTLDSKTTILNDLNQHIIKDLIFDYVENLSGFCVYDDEVLNSFDVYTNQVQFSQMVNVYNEEPKPLEWELFKAGKINLYCADLIVKVKINNTDIKEDDLHKIMNDISL